MAASGLQADPVSAFVKIQTGPVGTLGITKSADNGTVSIVLPAGTYAIQEINLDTNTYPDSRQLRIEPGKTTIVSFQNKKSNPV